MRPLFLGPHVHGIRLGLRPDHAEVHDAPRPEELSPSVRKGILIVTAIAAALTVVGCIELKLMGPGELAVIAGGNLVAGLLFIRAVRWFAGLR
jgi:hypothetical protein